VPVAGPTFPPLAADRSWKVVGRTAQILALNMGLNEHLQGLKVAEQRVESLKVSL
jgi:hypothetical protein